MTTVTLTTSVTQPVTAGTQFDIRAVLAGDDGPQLVTQTFTLSGTDGNGDPVTATLQVSKQIPDPDGPTLTGATLTCDDPSVKIVADPADQLLFHVTV